MEGTPRDRENPEEGVWPLPFKPWAAVLILLAVAMVPRVLGLVLMVAPARDSIRFIEAAKTFEQRPFFDACRNIETHPGYPWLLLQSRRLVDGIAGSASPYHWLYGAQILGTCAFAFLLVLAFAAGTLLWNGRIAFWGCLGTALLPRAVTYSIDILSDGVHAALWMAGFFFLVWNWRRIAVWKCVLAGGFAAFAYWTRIEAVLLPMIFAGAIILTQAWPAWRWDWGRSATVVLGFFIPFVLVAGLYVHHVGRLSVRPVAGEIVGELARRPSGESDMPSRRLSHSGLEAAEICGSEAFADGEAELLPPITSKGGKTRLEKLGVVLEDRKVIRGYERTSAFEAIVFLFRELGEETRVWILALLPLAILPAARRSLRFPAGILPILALWACMAMLVAAKMKAGYLAGRYALPVLPLLAMFALVGFDVLLHYLRGLPPLPWEKGWESHRIARRRRLAGSLFLGIVVAVLCLPHWFRPLHASRFGSMAAADWLARNSHPDDTVFDNTGLSAFFSNRREWQPQDRVPRMLPIRYAVIDVLAVERKTEPELTLLAHIHEQGRLVATFPTRRDKQSPGVYLFELRTAQARDARLPQIR